MTKTVASLSIMVALAPTLVAGQTLMGPGKQISAKVEVTAQGRLAMSILRGASEVLRVPAMGVTVQGQDLGLAVQLGAAAGREISETFPCRGVKAQGVHHCMAFELPVTHKASKTQWTLDLRVFDDGVAWRYRVPGAGRRHINGEATLWQLPADVEVWLQNDTRNYEGSYHRSRASEMAQRDDKGRDLFIGCPLTAQLPQSGYVLISEANLFGYSGMTLQHVGQARLQAVFEDDPKGWDAEGPIVSPWRVTLVAADLNALVNSDVIQSLAEKPDASLFPQGANTSWIRPGKGPCTWCVFGNDGAQWHRQKWWVDMCAAINCEYLLLDGGWRSEKWGFRQGGANEWVRMKELCDYAATKNVGILVWHGYPEGRDDSPPLTSAEAREDFLHRCKQAGVKGVKIDFFDSESKATIDVYEDLLRRTAKHQLMISFHGANKPTGESRTWPHQITQEGIREQEYVLWDKIALEHYGALPFTRMVVGHGDFLPTYVRPQYLRNTTAVFQLATAIIYTSPFLCWPDHPEAYLESPFLNLIRTMPTVWDETRVLEGSAIGTRVAFARRLGTDWYVALLNCEDKPVDHELDLSFLGDGDYQAALYHDGEEAKTASRIDAGGSVRKSEKLKPKLQPGGGFVAKLTKPAKYTQ